MHAPKTLGDRGAIARPAPSCINQTISITCLLCRLRSAAFAITMSPRSNISAANVPTCAFHPVTGCVFSEEFRGYGRFTNTTLSLSLSLRFSLCARFTHKVCRALAFHGRRNTRREFNGTEKHSGARNEISRLMDFERLIRWLKVNSCKRLAILRHVHERFTNYRSSGGG